MKRNQKMEKAGRFWERNTNDEEVHGRMGEERGLTRNDEATNSDAGWFPHIVGRPVCTHSCVLSNGAGCWVLVKPE